MMLDFGTDYVLYCKTTLKQTEYDLHPKTN